MKRERLCPLASHRGAETAVQLDHNQLLEERLDLGIDGRFKIGQVAKLEER